MIEAAETIAQKAVFEVRKTPCEHCLFTNKKLVCDKRKDEIIESCLAGNKHFVCHESTIENNGQVCCRSFYNKHKKDILIIRIAEMLKIITFVDTKPLDSYESDESTV